MKEDWDQMSKDAETQLGIEHKNNVWWFDAPLPRQWHKCSVWTSSFEVDRCACGALRRCGSQYWMYKNSRKKKSDA